MFIKLWKFTSKRKPLVTSILFILHFQKNWITFMMISKIKLKIFQINLILEFFTWEWLELLLKFYSLEKHLFFNKHYPNFLAGFLLFTYFLEFALFFSIFFLNKNCQIKKFWNQKTCWLRGEGVNPTIQSQKFTNIKLCFRSQRKQM